MNQIKVHRILSLEGDYPSIDEVFLTEEQWRDIQIESSSLKLMCDEAFSGHHEEYGEYSGTNTYEVKITPEKALIYEGHFYGVIVPTTGGLLLADGKRYGRSSALVGSQTDRDRSSSKDYYYLVGTVSRVVYPFALSLDGTELLGYYEDYSDRSEGLIVPAGVTRIADEVFNDRRCVRKVVLPEGLREIGKKAFYECALDEINLPSTLEKIGEKAFSYAERLKKISIPKGCQIGKDAFFCSGIEEADFQGGEPSYQEFGATPLARSVRG